MSPLFLTRLRAEWAPSIPRELLAGAVATFALIPEVIAFSFVAGVDPSVGLFASFVISIVIAFAGARPAMVSAAAGSVALVAAPLVQSHGLEYLFAAGLLAGAVQLLFGALRLGVLVRFVSSSVRTGFVNALAILIFAAQWPHLAGANAATWAMLALSALSACLGLGLPTVADLGQLPDTLPLFGLPEVPLSLQTLQIIALPALAMAMVGLLESVLTAAVVDELTDTPSNKNRECTGLGLANIAASCFGGIAGCGMIGQAVGNVKYGGRGRLSTLFAGVFLLVLMVALKPWVSQVPVVALVAIMVMVSAETFDWKSLRTLVRHPRLSSAVMLATVVVTIGTHNLAAGVAVGVVLSGVFFAVKVSRMLDVQCEDIDGDGDGAGSNTGHTLHSGRGSTGVDAGDTGSTRSADGTGTGMGSAATRGQRIWRVAGQVFFASADAFIEAFDVLGAEHRHVTIDVSRAHFWDVTAVAALDKVVQRLRQHGCTVQVLGLSEASAVLIDRLRSD